MDEWIEQLLISTLKNSNDVTIVKKMLDELGSAKNQAEAQMKLRKIIEVTVDGQIV